MILKFLDYYLLANKIFNANSYEYLNNYVLITIYLVK